MRANRGNVLAPGFRRLLAHGQNDPARSPTSLFPAFTSRKSRDWHMGNRLQLQQRNCFRFSRNSFHRFTNGILAKNWMEDARETLNWTRRFCHGRPLSLYKTRAFPATEVWTRRPLRTHRQFPH
jgi:hypothetical protein